MKFQKPFINSSLLLENKLKQISSLNNFINIERNFNIQTNRNQFLNCLGNTNESKSFLSRYYSRLLSNHLNQINHRKQINYIVQSANFSCSKFQSLLFDLEQAKKERDEKIKKRQEIERELLERERIQTKTTHKDHTQQHQKFSQNKNKNAFPRNDHLNGSKSTKTTNVASNRVRFDKNKFLEIVNEGLISKLDSEKIEEIKIMKKKEIENIFQPNSQNLHIQVTETNATNIQFINHASNQSNDSIKENIYNNQNNSKHHHSFNHNISKRIQKNTIQNKKDSKEFISK